LVAEERAAKCAIALVVAMALIMTPAAYHRMVERGQVSRSLIDFASRLIACAMAAFMVAIALNTFLLASVVLKSALGRGSGMRGPHPVWGTLVGYPMLVRAQKPGTRRHASSRIPWDKRPR
jgi:hypothetical protein